VLCLLPCSAVLVQTELMLAERKLAFAAAMDEEQSQFAERCGPTLPYPALPCPYPGPCP